MCIELNITRWSELASANANAAAKENAPHKALPALHLCNTCVYQGQHGIDPVSMCVNVQNMSLNRDKTRENAG